MKRLRSAALLVFNFTLAASAFVTVMAVVYVIQGWMMFFPPVKRRR